MPQGIQKGHSFYLYSHGILHNSPISSEEVASSQYITIERLIVQYRIPYLSRMESFTQRISIIPYQNLEADAASRSTTIPASARTRQCVGNNGVCAIVTYHSGVQNCFHEFKVVKHRCGGRVSVMTGEPVFCAPFTPRLVVRDAAVDTACSMCRISEARRRNTARTIIVHQNAHMLEAEQAALFAAAAARQR